MAPPGAASPLRPTDFGQNRGPMTLVQLLGGREFRRLLTSQLISNLGSGLATVALLALVFDLTGSATAVGGVLALRLVPGAVAGPLGARLSRRWDRKRTLLLMDGVRVGFAALLPFVPQVWWVLGWVLASEVAALVYLPARDSVVGDLVPDRDELPVANGLMLAATYGTLPLGAGIFALYAATIGPALHGIPGGHLAPVFWADAASYALSVLLIARTAIPADRDDETADLLPRFRDAWQIPLVRRTTGPVVAAAFGLGTVFSLGIVFAVDTLGASEAQFGTFVILFGVGAGLGVGLMHLRPPPNHLEAMWRGLGTLGAVLVGMSLAPAIGLALVAAVLFGAAATYAIVAAISALQVELDGRPRLLAFTAFHVLLRLALAAGALVAGAVAELLAVAGGIDPVRMVMAGGGGVVVVAVLWHRWAGR